MLVALAHIQRVCLIEKVLFQQWRGGFIKSAVRLDWLPVRLFCVFFPH